MYGVTDNSRLEAEVGQELDGGGDVSSEVQLARQTQVTSLVPVVQLHAEVDQPLESLRVIDKTGKTGCWLTGSDLLQVPPGRSVGWKGFLRPLDDLHGVIPMVGEVLHVPETIIKHGLNVIFTHCIFLTAKLHFKVLWELFQLFIRRGREMSAGESGEASQALTSPA